MDELIEKAKEHLRTYGFSGLATNSCIPAIMAEFASIHHKSQSGENKEETPEHCGKHHERMAERLEMAKNIGIKHTNKL